MTNSVVSHLSGELVKRNRVDAVRPCGVPWAVETDDVGNSGEEFRNRFSSCCDGEDHTGSPSEGTNCWTGEHDIADVVESNGQDGRHVVPAA